MRSESIEAVLVTGGAGFIGSHLVDALMTQGAKVSSSTTSPAEPYKTLNHG